MRIFLKNIYFHPFDFSDISFYASQVGFETARMLFKIPALTAAAPGVPPMFVKDLS